MLSYYPDNVICSIFVIQIPASAITAGDVTGYVIDMLLYRAGWNKLLVGTVAVTCIHLIIFGGFAIYATLRHSVTRNCNCLLCIFTTFRPADHKYQVGQHGGLTALTQ